MLQALIPATCALCALLLGGVVACLWLRWQLAPQSEANLKWSAIGAVALKV